MNLELFLKTDHFDDMHGLIHVVDYVYRMKSTFYSDFTDIEF